MFFLLIAATTSKANIHFDKQIPQLEFAANEISTALKSRDTTVFLEVQVDSTSPESFSIRKLSDGGFRIVGTDIAGAMYGGLELAEQLRIGGIESVRSITQKPYMAMRGMKYNIPLDVRTPSYSDMSDAGQHAMEHIWDINFWKEMIDELARHRYNFISLWNLHPFPSLVKVPEYPDIALDDVLRSTKVRSKSFSLMALGYNQPEIVNNVEIIKKISIDEKIDFWREVMRYGKTRNVDFYIVTWNIYAYGTAGKYGIDNKVDNKTTIDYYRKSVEQLILTYPDLKGIGLTTGEDMRDVSFHAKEEWAYNTYGLGVLDAMKELPKRKITFLHRQHLTNALDVADKFKLLIDHPNIEFLYSFKYAKAHVYSATEQPYHENFVKKIKTRGNLKTIWTMRNDSTYIHRWAAPDYVREFVQNIPHDVSRGYYFGSDGWIWSRNFFNKSIESKQKLDVSNHWFHFMLWGRLAYDPKISTKRFSEILGTRFPQTNTQELMKVWQSASMAFPLVTGYHWGALDLQWYPEACISRPGASKTKSGFHDVNRFITLRPHPKSGYISIPDYVEATLKGKKLSQLGPLEVAALLKDGAQESSDLIKMIDFGSSNDLEETLADIKSMSLLGHYYSHKIIGATKLHFYRKTGIKTYQEAAIDELEQAVSYWKLYTKGMLKRYNNPIWMNRVPTIDWEKLSALAGEDILIAKNNDTP